VLHAVEYAMATFQRKTEGQQTRHRYVRAFLARDSLALARALVGRVTFEPSSRGTRWFLARDSLALARALVGRVTFEPSSRGTRWRSPARSSAGLRSSLPRAGLAGARPRVSAGVSRP
jgi:hypothetical protein